MTPQGMNFFADQSFPLRGSMPNDSGQIAHIAKYYGIQYNHAGRVALRVGKNGPLQEAEGPHVFFTWPGMYFEYGPPPGETRHHNFICTFGARVKTYREGGLFPLNRLNALIPVADADRFLLTMLEIMELLRKSTLTPPRAVLLFEDLLLQVHEAKTGWLRRKLPAFQEDFLSRLADRVRKNPQNEIDFAEEARKCGVTFPHFRRLFKEKFGLPPHRFHLRCRLEFAASLLLTGNGSVSETGELSGFANPFYFSRMFKAEYRISPLDYRKEYIGKNGTSGAPALFKRRERKHRGIEKEPDIPCEHVDNQ